jgi:hypothetical protein
MTTATISLSQYCSRDLTRLTPQGAAAAAMACQCGAAQRIPERASRSPRRSRDGELLPSPSGLSLLSCCHVLRLAQRPHPDDAGHRSPEKITIACSSSTSADTPSPCPRLIGAQRGIYHWRLESYSLLCYITLASSLFARCRHGIWAVSSRSNGWLISIWRFRAHACWAAELDRVRRLCAHA